MESEQPRFDLPRLDAAAAEPERLSGPGPSERTGHDLTCARAGRSCWAGNRFVRSP